LRGSGRLDTRLDTPPISLRHHPGSGLARVAILWVPIDFYYPEFQPGRKIFGHWLEYNEEAAADATRRMREFL